MIVETRLQDLERNKKLHGAERMMALIGQLTDGRVTFDKKRDGSWAMSHSAYESSLSIDPNDLSLCYHEENEGDRVFLDAFRDKLHEAFRPLYIVRRR